jgi:hypothetical protein
MKIPRMKRGLALFLQGVIALIGIVTVGLLLWEPHLEGRNVHATTFEIYFKDPFLAYAYAGSIPFFVALYRAFALLGDFRRVGTFSQLTLNALRAIKRCAVTILGFVAGGAIIIILWGDQEDRPAGFVMSLLVAFAAGIMAIGAGTFARNLQSALKRPEGHQAS